MPTAHEVVIGNCFVQRNRQIAISRPPDLVELPGFAVFVEHFAEDLDARAVAQQLPRREQIAPQGHAVALRFHSLVAVGDALARHDVERFPFGQFLGEPLPDRRPVVVFGPRRAVAAHPLVLAPLARLQPARDAPLIDDGVELLAHLPRLRLPLDLLAVDDPPAIAPRTKPGAARRRPRRLLLDGINDGERANPRPLAEAGLQAHPPAVRRQPPVRRQGHNPAAIRTNHRPRPKVGHIDTVGKVVL